MVTREEPEVIHLTSPSPELPTEVTEEAGALLNTETPPQITVETRVVLPVFSENLPVVSTGEQNTTDTNVPTVAEHIFLLRNPLHSGAKHVRFHRDSSGNLWEQFQATEYEPTKSRRIRKIKTKLELKVIKIKFLLKLVLSN